MIAVNQYTTDYLSDYLFNENWDAKDRITQTLSFRTKNKSMATLGRLKPPEDTDILLSYIQNVRMFSI